MLKEIFLEGFNLDKSALKTSREAYFHQLGKFEELSRFFNLTEEDLK